MVAASNDANFVFCERNVRTEKSPESDDNPSTSVEAPAKLNTAEAAKQ